MLSLPLLAQDDFSCLGLAAGQDALAEDADIQPLECHRGLNHAACGGSLKAETQCGVEDLDSQENSMVYHLKRQNNAHTIEPTDMHLKDGDSVFEPMRLMWKNPAPPPKLFYGTFWRSLARKIVQLKKDIALGRTPVSEVLSSRVIK